jgi:phage tail protein X
MYTTIQGDTWDIISKKFYNTENLVNVLLRANPAYISTVIFSSGVDLIIPEIDIEEELNNLPPWRL